MQTSVYLASTADQLHDAVKLLEAAHAAGSMKGTTNPPPACAQLAHSPERPTDDTTGHTPATGENLSIH